MYFVDLYARVRRACHVDGLSNSAAARLLGIDRKTVAPLSLRNVEDLLHERGIDIRYETIRFWWNRFGPSFASEIRNSRVRGARCYSNWKWHLDEVFVKVNGEKFYLWRAVDH